MNSTCMEHSGHTHRLDNLEKGQDDLRASINSAHVRIDGMKNWVIAGMASLVGQLIMFSLGLALYWVRTGEGLQ